MTESDVIAFLDDLRKMITNLHPAATTKEMLRGWREIDRGLDHAICMLRVSIRKKESDISAYHEMQRLREEKKELERKKKEERESVERLLGAIREQVPDLKQVNLKMLVSQLKKEQRKKSSEKAIVS